MPALKYVSFSLVFPLMRVRNNCAGVYEDMLVTVSFPCSEIILWNKDTLEKTREISTPLKLSGCTHIENDSMYICSRNILGIDRIKLSE